MEVKYIALIMRPEATVDNFVSYEKLGQVDEEDGGRPVYSLWGIQTTMSIDGEEKNAI